MDEGIRVVAVVAPAGLVLEAIEVLVGVVGLARAVVVRPVAAHLGRDGRDRRVAVVTVRASAGFVDEQVPVHVPVVNGAVTVVVGAVAGLGRAREDPGIAVVAVPVHLGEAVAIVVHQHRALVHLAVTVVVREIRDLRGAVVGERIQVVAVVPAAGLVHVAVPVQVPIVDHPVAVVVDPVADLQGVGVDEGVGVVAVRARAGLVHVAVHVLVRVVAQPAAVVVGAVAADLGRRRIDRRVRVVTIGAPAGGVVESVRVLVQVVGHAVAVVVQPVAALLHLGRVDQGIPVVAVRAPAGRGQEAVAVLVVPEPVAVVVDPVTDLGGTGVGGGRGVVAVVAGAERRDVPIAVPVEIVGGAVAVVVLAVAADLGGAQVGVGIQIVAVGPPAVVGHLPVQVQVPVVDHAVAVVVRAVAELHGRRVRAGIRIVAVPVQLRVAVAVVVVLERPLVHQTVAVVVHRVAHAVAGPAVLGGAGVDRVVRVVAVSGLGAVAARQGPLAVPVPVVVVEHRALVHRAVAVVVLQVRQLHGVGVGVRVRVVAVAVAVLDPVAVHVLAGIDAHQHEADVDLAQIVLHGEADQVIAHRQGRCVEAHRAGRVRGVLVQDAVLVALPGHGEGVRILVGIADLAGEQDPLPFQHHGAVRGRGDGAARGIVGPLQHVQREGVLTVGAPGVHHAEGQDVLADGQPRQRELDALAAFAAAHGIRIVGAAPQQPVQVRGQAHGQDVQGVLVVRGHATEGQRLVLEHLGALRGHLDVGLGGHVVGGDRAVVAREQGREGGEDEGEDRALHGASGAGVTHLRVTKAGAQAEPRVGGPARRCQGPSCTLDRRVRSGRPATRSHA